MEEQLQIEVCYSGQVQGVGFRYEVRQVARDYRVTGYVENLADGRVHLLAEGERGEVGRFLEGVRHALGAYIRHAEEIERVAPPEYGDFRIRL